MFGIWIPITISGALFQCLRTAQQKRLTPIAGPSAANLARFAYGMPFACLSVLGFWLYGAPIPTPNPTFAMWVLIGGTSQIIASACLVQALSLGNFAVGTAYSKTEVVQAAIFSALLIGETVNLLGWIAILIGVAGVLMLSLGARKVNMAAFLAIGSDPAARYGLISGALFGMSAVGFRGATVALGDFDPVVRGLTTLAAATTFQTTVFCIWLALREPAALASAVRHWRPAGSVGVLSFLGSACWFVAFSLEHAANVRALGQVELVFTLLVSRLGFREKLQPRELAGIGLIVASVLTLILTR